MSKVITPILLIIASIGMFFSYLRPGYDVLQAFQAKSDRLDESIEQSKSLLEVHNRLLADYSSVGPENISKLNRILPENTDSIRIILDLNALAIKHNLIVKAFDLPDPAKENNKTTRPGNKTTPEVEDDKLGKSFIALDFTGKYDDFKNFLKDVERNVTLMDVVSILVVADNNTDDTSDQEIMYKVGIQTYWLK